MIVYRCINLTNSKSYIGLTKNSLEQRIAGHKFDCKSQSNPYSKFYNAVNKVGWDNFRWEIVESCTSIEELRKREIYWIKYYRDLLGKENVYNISDGGSGGDNYIDNPRLSEIKKKISRGVRDSMRWTSEKKLVQSAITKRRWESGVFNENNSFISNNPMKNDRLRQKHLQICSSEEYKKKISECVKGRVSPSKETRDKISSKLKGRVVSQETREKISMKAKGRTISSEAREKIGKFNRGKTISLETRTKMSNALVGRRVTQETRTLLSKENSKEWWVQFDKDTQMIIHIFDNSKQLEAETGFNSSNIVDKDEFLRRAPYGYKWKRFKKDEVSKEELYKLFGKSL